MTDTAETTEEAAPQQELPEHKPTWWQRHYTFTGTVLALVFLWLSLTPSLLPRGPLFQGLVSGAAGAFGYGLGVFLVAALIFFVWRQAELLQHGFEVSELREERLAQEKVNTRLRVKLESLKAPRRIEDLAMRKLHMIHPGPDDGGVIHRVIVNEGPDSSVLARR